MPGTEFCLKFAKRQGRVDSCDRPACRFKAKVRPEKQFLLQLPGAESAAARARGSLKSRMARSWLHAGCIRRGHASWFRPRRGRTLQGQRKSADCVCCVMFGKGEVEVTREQISFARSQVLKQTVREQESLHNATWKTFRPK